MPTWKAFTLTSFDHTQPISRAYFLQYKKLERQRLAQMLTSPLPSLAPVIGLTATEPRTIKSTFIFSSNPIGLPYLATPAEVQASLMVPADNILSSSTEKKPVLRRGCGVNSCFPPAKE